MAAPTNTADVKKALANSEPSTHGPKLKCRTIKRMSRVEGEADIKS